MNILSILNELAANNSRLSKEKILKREQYNELLKNVFKAAYDPFINYWQVKIPSYSSKKIEYSLDEALKKLDVLSTRQLTGNAAIDFFSELLSLVSLEDAEVLERIIQRDLKCGVSTATVNKIWPGLVPTFEVCLAWKDITGITYPAFAQIKYDGGRCHLHYDGQNVQAFSRNGKIIELYSVFLPFAKKLMKPGEVLDGEIVFFEDDKPMDRKTSNGLFNKGIKGTISKEEALKAKFITWDLVDFLGKIPYKERLEELENRWHKLSEQEKFESNIFVVQSTVVKNEEEAQAFYDQAIADGHEGAILKNFDFKWEPKRVKGMGKMKAEEEADLRVMAWHVGTGKYSNCLGSITAMTEDCKLRVNVGSGWSDEERKKLKPDDLLDKIITVRYNQLIKAKEKGFWSLFLPRFVKIRYDKSKANYLEELK